jgi:hypothetical protein
VHDKVDAAKKKKGECPRYTKNTICIPHLTSSAPRIYNQDEIGHVVIDNFL